MFFNHSFSGPFRGGRDDDYLARSDVDSGPNIA